MILALHGFGGSARDFDLIAARLEGVGFSAIDLEPPCFTISDRDLRDRVLLGYSMGARVALDAALRAPDRVKGLVLVGATAGIEDATLRARRRRQDETLAREILRDGVKAFSQRWERAPLIRSQRRIPQPYRDQMRARRRRVPAETLIVSLRTVGQGVFKPLWHRLPELAIPTLLVTGAEDEKYTAIARRMCDALPRAEHVTIEGAGHAAHLEAPDRFCEALRTHLG